MTSGRMTSIFTHSQNVTNIEEEYHLFMYCPFYQVLDDIRKNDINIYTFPECDSDEDEEFKEQDKALKVSNIVNSNVPSFIGYLNNTVIKLPIYFNSQMHIE